MTQADYYWLHALGSSNYENVQKVKAFDFIAEKKAEGKIRHIGFSFHDSPELLERILKDHPEVEYVQLQLNYLDWENEAIQAKACYEIATHYGKPVIVMEPIKGGTLVNILEKAAEILKRQAPDLSVTSWAIRFAATHENVMMVLSGMGNMEQMEDNLSYMKDFQPLSEKEMSVLKEATDAIRAGIAIPCTACRYCVSESECPKKIVIPDYFSIYNNLKCFSQTQGMVASVYYNNLTKTHGKASECIGGGSMNEIKVFENKVFGKVQAIELDSEWRFELYSVGMALGQVKAAKGNLYPRKERIDENIKNAEIKPVVHNGQLWITEPEMYDLMFETHTEKVKPFKKWITSEILPSIRKHGIYATDNVIDKILNNPDFGIELLTKLKEERKARVEVEKKNAILMHVNKTYTMTEIAKELGLKSAIQLNKMLSEKKVQYQINGTWVMYSQYSDLGYEEIKQEVLDSGKVIYHRKITQMGREFILGLFGHKKKSA